MGADDEGAASAGFSVRTSMAGLGPRGWMCMGTHEEYFGRYKNTTSLGGPRFISGIENGMDKM